MKKRTLSLFVAVSIAAGCLAGCGGGSQTTATTAGGTSETQATQGGQSGEAASDSASGKAHGIGAAVLVRAQEHLEVGDESRGKLF